MKKITILLLTALLLCTAACNSSTGSSPTETPAPSASTTADAQTYTGILEQIKAEMILVVPENDDSIVYAFGTEGITIDAQLGEKVTVTYTGDMNDIDSLLEASKVEVLK